MEKRTFLAIILSIFVLFLWQGLMGNKAPKIQPKSVSSSQPIENKEVTSVLTSVSKPVSLPETKIIHEKTVELSNEKLSVKFSNIGGAIKSVDIKNKQLFPVSNFSTPAEYDLSEFELENETSDMVIYKLVSGENEIRKIYKLSKQEYVVDQETIIKNISGNPSLNTIDFNALQINMALVAKINPQENGLYEYSFSSAQKTFRKSSAFKFTSKDAKTEFVPVKWVGFRDKYYCAVFKPEFETVSYKVNPVSETDTILSIQTKPIALNSGAEISLKGFYYFGPQDLELLAKQGLGDYVVFSQYGILDFFSKMVLKIVYFLHKFIPSLGLCIILVSIIIYGLMYPLTMKGMTSMKKMQTLQPKIAKLKEQYKSNPQKMNQEVMALYKQNSINPFGGCLPFILQMPVFIGLYQALWRSVIFQGQGFLWIKDLSMPDRLFVLPNSLPLIGHNINILPVIMMVAMFFQQKISSKNMVVTDETQAMQQKMMMWLFPVILGVLFYNFGSGLNIYFTVFYILSTLSQLKMSKMDVVKSESAS